MSNKELLYVAYSDERLEEGISYAIYLSKLRSESLQILLLNRNGTGNDMSRFDELMAAAVFAEAHDLETARGILSGGGAQATATLQQYLVEKCQSQGIAASVHTGVEDCAPAIISFLEDAAVDLVLLSPGVSECRDILAKLLESSPRPVVTMVRGTVLDNAQTQD